MVSANDKDPRASPSEALRRLAIGLAPPVAIGRSSSFASSGGGSVGSGAAFQPPRIPSRSSSPAGSVSLMPSARAGGLAGGGLSGKSPGVTVPVVLFTGQSCGGVIKSPGKDLMCVKVDCGYRSHQTKSPFCPAPGERCFFIATSKKQAVLPSPSLKEDECSEVARQVLLGERKPIEAWVHFFQATQEDIDSRKAFPSNTEETMEEALNVEDILDLSRGSFSPLPIVPPVDPPKFSGGDSEILAQSADTILSIVNTLGIVRESLESVNDSLAQAHDDKEEFLSKFVFLVRLAESMSQVIGDRTFIRDNFSSVSEALCLLQENYQDLRAVIEQEGLDREDIDASIQERVEAANEEIALRVRDLALRVQDLESRANTPSDQGPDVFETLRSVLFDHTGRLNPNLLIGEVDEQTITLGDLFREVRELKSTVKEMQSQIVSKGGMRVGTLFFASKSDLEALIRKENPTGKVLRIYVCALTIFAHARQFSPKDQSAYKSLNSDMPLTDMAVVEAARSKMCPPYTGDATSYTMGKPIDAFRPTVWEGQGIGGGRQSEIHQKLSDCVEKINAAALANFGPYSSTPSHTLFSLSQTMAIASDKWHRSFISHLNDEMRTLKALNLPEADILLLFSDLFQSIMERWHTQYVGVHDLNDSVDPVTRLTDYIWACGQVHMNMQEFLDLKFVHHPIVQSAFVRFLTRKTGENTSASVGTKLDDLTKKTSEAKRDAKDAKDKAKAAADAVENLLKKNDLKK